MDYYEKIKYIEENFGKYKNVEYFYRFWEKVDIKVNTKECWNWLANVAIYEYDYEYSKFWCHNKMIRTNRVAYTLSKGDISDNKVVMHTCNNPICCNPNHLKLGSLSENSRYMVGCGRWNNYGENNGFSKLTDDQVRQIHKTYKEQRYQHPEFKQWQILEPIAKKFKIDSSNLNRIVNGKTWRRIYDEFHKD